MRMMYNNKIHTVVHWAIENLRSARNWEAEALGAEESNRYNYYGISYAMSKSEDLWHIAKMQYLISKKMRKYPERVDSLYRRALRLDEEADKIENR